jgi:hypothetical protein
VEVARVMNYNNLNELVGHIHFTVTIYVKKKKSEQPGMVHRPRTEDREFEALGYTERLLTLKKNFFKHFNQIYSDALQRVSHFRVLKIPLGSK